MSKLYWMSQVVASNSSSELTFTPTTLSGLSSTNINDAINEAATNKTGVRKSKSLSAGATSFSFTDTKFTSDMYVDYYASSKIELTDFPTYNDGTKTITFKCKALEAACNFRLVVQF